MDLPIKHGGPFHSYVSLPEGIYDDESLDFGVPHFQTNPSWSLPLLDIFAKTLFQRLCDHIDPGISWSQHESQRKLGDFFRIP